jgi:molecular chaperone HtpG
MVTLKEYVSRMQEGQDKIYYASGESYDKIDLLPQVDAVKDKGYEILYLKDNIDEFVFQLMLAYDGKNFMNVAAENVDLTSDEEKENLKKLNEENKDMFAIMKEVIPDIEVVRFTNRLKNHAVCLTSEGQLSIEMAKTMNAMNDEQIKPQMVLEINENNKIAEKIKKLYVEDKEELKNYTKILYAQARLIEGLSVENPTEISNLICDILSK